MRILDGQEEIREGQVMQTNRRKRLTDASLVLLISNGLRGSSDADGPGGEIGVGGAPGEFAEGESMLSVLDGPDEKFVDLADLGAEMLVMGEEVREV